MKRPVLTTTLSLFLATASLAGAQAIAQQTQPASPGTQGAAASARMANPQRQTMRLAKQLNLTAEQAAKVEPILADRDQKIAALRADTSIAPVVAKQQMRLIQKSTREQMSAILTTEQIEQFKAMHAHSRKAPVQPLTPAPAAAS
jgi:Spy/CpxP family protein refolding chaperone